MKIFQQNKIVNQKNFGRANTGYSFQSFPIPKRPPPLKNPSASVLLLFIAPCATPRETLVRLRFLCPGKSHLHKTKRVFTRTRRSDGHKPPHQNFPWVSSPVASSIINTEARCESEKDFHYYPARSINGGYNHIMSNSTTMNYNRDGIPLPAKNPGKGAKDA